MSGRPDDQGQLALMDAVVFFLAAMVVSGILFSTVSDTVDEDRSDSCSWFDPERALAAMMRSSIGSETQVVVGGQSLILEERVEIAECILLEAHIIAEGDAGFDFSALNSILSEVVNGICGRSMHAGLCVYELLNGTPSELFSIPRSWTDTRITYASTAELADSGGSVYLVQLRSAPAGFEPS